MSYNTVVPCAQNPEVWFGYDQSRGRRSPEEEAQIARAKMLCTHACPLAEQRKCAKAALESEATYGIWAGVELMLHKTDAATRRDKLTAGRRQLRIIATGTNRVAASA